MRYIILALLSFITSTVFAHNEKHTAAQLTDSSYRPAQVHHIVLFKFKPDMTQAQKQLVIGRFRALATSKRNTKLYIQSITGGFQNSHEGARRGYEVGFIVNFTSEGDRNYYVGTPYITDAQFFDPNHNAFKQFVGPLLANNGALIMDYND